MGHCLQCLYRPQTFLHFFPANHSAFSADPTFSSVLHSETNAVIAYFFALQDKVSWWNQWESKTSLALGRSSCEQQRGRVIFLHLTPTATKVQLHPSACPYFQGNGKYTVTQ